MEMIETMNMLEGKCLIRALMTKKTHQVCLSHPSHEWNACPSVYEYNRKSAPGSSI
jgi:hypothetical protein